MKKITFNDTFYKIEDELGMYFGRAIISKGANHPTRYYLSLDRLTFEDLEIEYYYFPDFISLKKAEQFLKRNEKEIVKLAKKHIETIYEFQRKLGELK